MFEEGNLVSRKRSDGTKDTGVVLHVVEGSENGYVVLFKDMVLDTVWKETLPESALAFNVDFDVCGNGHKSGTGEEQWKQEFSQMKRLTAL